MGNVESTNNNNIATVGPGLKRTHTASAVERIEKPQKGKRRQPKRRSLEGRVVGGLGDQDLDDIYKFVQHMKSTNLGESMLEDLVVKQACQADEDLSRSVSLCEDDSFPIEAIPRHPPANKSKPLQRREVDV